ncbi:hypothetical protein Btru_043275 [Bulinus truncatus]|nr:hypothetical protein Btru_043275 [Bulinus truncatus]
MDSHSYNGFPRPRHEDLAKTNCTKNPGHVKFYPVQTFSTKLLPACYHHDPDISKLVHVISDLTAKLEVYYISQNRPKVIQVTPNVRAPYPLSDENGFTNDPECGTGIVSEVVETDGSWNIHINTCRHVVFDNLEAQHTMCTLSFEFSVFPSVKLRARKVILYDNENDVCQIMCTITDKNLAMQLKQLTNDFGKLGQRVFNLYKRVKGCERQIIIVSFPHAISKHVTIGTFASEPSAGARAISYNTDTCPCCSGAYLLVLGGDSFLNTYLHRGSRNNGINFSTDGFGAGERLTDILHPPHQLHQV